MVTFTLIVIISTKGDSGSCSVRPLTFITHFIQKNTGHLKKVSVLYFTDCFMFVQYCQFIELNV